MNDPVSESAKATQKVAEAYVETLKIGRDVGGWFNRLFESGLKATVGRRWADVEIEKQIAGRIYSWARLELLFHKTEQKLRKKGVTQFRFLPPKLMLPLLENATMEDEDDLHSLWAQLLATSLDSQGEEVHRKFVSILSDLTSADALVLSQIWADWQTRDIKETRDSTLTYGSGIDGVFSYPEMSIVTINRLGLIAPNYTTIKTFEPGGEDHTGDWGPTQDEVQVYGNLNSIVFTKLGEAFCRAVMPTEASLVK